MFTFVEIVDAHQACVRLVATLDAKHPGAVIDCLDELNLIERFIESTAHARLAVDEAAV
jgi:hypothetical protein